jgi:beta-mannan synthase
VFLAAASLLAPLRRCPAAVPIAAPDEDGDDVDEEAGGRVAAGYPMVLVQIPMYNEREVRAQSLAVQRTATQREAANDGSIRFLRV